MLRKRIIPIVLLDGFSVLKTINFSSRRNLGSPITVMRTYNTRNVDELILLDIDASQQNRAIDKFTIEEIAKDCFMPLTVGGGIRSLEDIRDLLNRGADKITLNTYALENPSFINEAASQFGAQCIVVSVDVIRSNGKYLIYSKGETLENLELVDWLHRIEEEGAGEILINSVEKDGTMEGADLELADLVARATRLPVIYAGGVSSPYDAASAGATSVSAIGISSIFHFTDATPRDCATELINQGIPARL